MPYVSESSPNRDRVFPLTGVGQGTGYTLTLPDGTLKTQYGYRSGPLSPKEEAAIENRSQQGKWAHVRTQINDLEAYDYDHTSRPDRPFAVNDRRFIANDFYPTAVRSDVSYDRLTPPFGRTDRSALGALGIRGFQGSFPTPPSNSQLEGMAGSLLRSSAPAKPEFNLMRFVGELRDAPSLFRAAAYRPDNLEEAGGAYLNYVFGVQPTVSDLQSMAETVVKADSVVKDFVSRQKVQLRRSRTRSIESLSDSGTTGPQTQIKGFASRDLSVGGKISYRAANLLNGGLVSTYDIAAYVLNWSWSYRSSVRSFATFEYFIEQPHNLESRLEYYRKAATRVVGGGLDLSTAYDLAPWTWLAGWFVDFGGLLRYQQGIADQSIVMSRSGFSFYEEAHANISVHYVRKDSSVPAVISGNVADTSAGANFRWRHHVRQSGSPYSISPTWSLNPQQWAITAALGLSQGGASRITRP